MLSDGTLVVSSPGPTGTSAAQNGPVTRICSKCGALLLEDPICSFCDLPDEAERASRRASAAGRGSSDQDNGMEWQREVSRRLEQYRIRKGRLNPADAQAGLPFKRGTQCAVSDRLLEVTLEAERPQVRPTPRPRPIAAEPMEICVQPAFDFSNLAAERARPQTALVPVASLGDRRWAAALDGLFLALTAGGFCTLFHSLGGVMLLEKMDDIVYAAVLYLFYGLYFFLFTTFAGATPGMQLRNLTIVRLDGSLPDTHQLLWRSFGYLLSGATLFFGFLWSIWDEDHFTWQDRISQTYITAAPPLFEADPIEVRPGRETFAHK